MPTKNIERLKPVKYGEGYDESGANPDFKVTSATRNAREMEMLMKRLTLQSKTFDRKLQALESVQQLRKEAEPILIEEIRAEEVKQEAPVK